MEPAIIFETPDFVAITKPAGLLVHAASKKDKNKDTLVSWALKSYPEIATVGDAPETRPGIVHRLDRETSGVMIIARNQNFFNYFKKLLQNHKVKKSYLALVAGLVSKPIAINLPIGLKSGTTKRTTKIRNAKMIKPALTEAKPLKVIKVKNETFTLLHVFPKTGRTHQIRVHLAAVGHPVANDKIYGGRKNLIPGLNRHFLHAESLEFTAENGERLRLETGLPEDLAKILTEKRLGIKIKL